MQRDHGLAGAGAAADRHDTLVGRADRAVLLGLDGRDDRVHRAVARPGQLRQQRALADDRQRLRGRVVGVEQVVLDAEDVHALAAQDPAAYDALRVCLRRLVEHRCRRGAPVDQQHVVVVVAQTDPADVARDVAHLRRPGRGVRRPGPRGRRPGSPSGGPPGRPSRRARRGRPRSRCGRGRAPRSPAPAPTEQPSPSGCTRCRRSPARSRPRERQRHCSTRFPLPAVVQGTNYLTGRDPGHVSQLSSGTRHTQVHAVTRRAGALVQDPSVDAVELSSRRSPAAGRVRGHRAGSAWKNIDPRLRVPSS